MSLKYAFAKVMNAVGIHPAAFFNEQLRAAVERDDRFKVENVLRANPDDAPSLRSLFAFAISEQKFAAAHAMAQVVPAVLTKDYSAGEDFINRSILMQRTIMGDMEEVQFLIGLKADARAKDDAGDTALHFAAGLGKLKTAEILVKAGAEINLANRQGITPLMEATKRDTSQMVEQLLEQGAMLDTCDNNGLNATMHAIRNQNIEAASVLLQQGGVITDFNDPAIERLQRVATYEAAFGFLQLLGAQFEQERKRAADAALQREREFSEAGTTQDIKVRPIRLRGQTP